MDTRKEKEKAVAPKKTRTTINLPEQAHMQLSRMTLKVRGQGVAMFKQNLAAKMIAYFNKNQHLLAEITKS